MITQTHSNENKGLVQEMRKIRDQISTEIKDMTFEEERAYLDKLLAQRNPGSIQHEVSDAGVDLNERP